MIRSPMIHVALLALATALASPADAQDADTNVDEMADVGDQADVQYYVLDDPDDQWQDDAMPEEEWLTFEEQDDDPATPAETNGVREPPGIPLFEGFPAGAQPSIGPVPRSFGGTKVLDATAPWQAQIYYPKIAPQWQARVAAGMDAWVLQHYCGGAMIAPQWVVTAAHCIDEDMMKAGYRVRLGQERIDQPGGWSYRIDRVVRYNPFLPLKSGDIALIHITSDQGQAAPPTQQVRAIPLFRGQDASPNDVVTAYGWGRTSQTGSATSALLLKVSLSIMDRPSCDKARVALIDNRVVCAKAPGAKTCSNDSGGPLVNDRRELVGIVSAGGRACADDGVPGVYTRIGAYLPWITQVTGGEVR